MKKLLIPLFALTILTGACTKDDQPGPITGALCSEPNKEDMLSSRKPVPCEKAAPSGNETGSVSELNAAHAPYNAARRLGDTPKGLTPVDDPAMPVHDTLNWQP